MASVDEKVVRMTFDNAKFEAGVQKTLETLAKLKSALNLDKAGSDFEKLQQASNKVNFSHMSDALDQVSNRFSTFGIVGMTVLQNLTTTAMNTAKNILSALTNPLIQGGKRRALNIEQAKFQIEGLGYAWEDVAEDINYGVKSTAYGLDSAAKAASQLLASNVKVGDSMKAALRGISGVAAMTSSEYDDIARVFTTVAGNGRLMGDQLNQLSARGLNVAATLGKALGKTEGEIREMVSKGKIDFATFSKAMDDAFGEHAKKANDTFTGALSNMKAALSRIGAEFATPAYTNLRHAMNALTPAIDDVKKALGPLYETASKAMEAASNLAVNILGNLNLQDKLAGPMEAANKIAISFGKTIVNLGKAIYRIVAPVVSAFDKAFGGTLIDIMVRAAEAIADFTSKLVISERMSTNIERTFIGVFTVLSVVSDILSRVAGFITGILWNAITGVFGFFFDIATSITAVVGDLIVGVKNLVDEIMSLRFVQAIIGAVEKAMEAIGFASDVAYKGVQGFADSLFDKTFETSALVLSKLADVIRLVAHALDDAIYKAAGFIKKLGELPATQRAIQKVSTTFGTLRTNVLNVSSHLASKLYPAFTKIKNVVELVISKIRGLKDQYIELPTMQEAVTRVIDFAASTFEKSIEIFEKVREVFTAIVDRVKDLTSVSFNEAVKNLKNLRDNIIETANVAGKLEALKNVFFGIKDGIIEMANTSGTMLNKVKEKLTTFVGWLGDKFSSITLGDVIAAGAGGSMIAFLLTFSKFLNQAANLAKAAEGFTKSILGLPSAVAKVLKGFAELEQAKVAQIKMESITGIIKAVALLAGAIAVLATMDQEKVKTSAIVIGILGASLIAITGVMTHLANTSTPDAVAKASTMMVALAGAMGIMVLALKILSKINMEGIEKRLIVMGALMAELAAFTIAVSRLSGDMAFGSVAVIAISISMLMLAKAFQNLSSIPIEQVASGTALMGAMILLIGVMSRVASSWQRTAAAALAIVAIAASIRIMIDAIKDLGSMDPDVADRGLASVGMIMLSFVALMIATASAGQYAMEAGAAMILVGVALHVIVEAINKIAAISETDVKKAQGVVGKILILFGVLIAMTKFSGENAAKAGIAIGLMSGAMVLLAGAMAILAQIDPDGLERATDAVTRVMAMFALIIASTSVVRKANKVITTMTICIAALAGVLVVLSLLEPKNLETATDAITRLMGMFALLLAVTKYTGKVRANTFIMLGVVLALGVMLQKLSELPADRALPVAESLSLLLLAFSASLFIVQDIPVSALEGVVALIGMITIFGAFLAAIGALNTYVPEIQTFLENGIPILELVGEGLGSFIGGIVNGLLSSASDSLPTIGSNLSAFMENMKGFIDGAKTIDDSVTSGINSIVGLVLAMAAADFLDALTWWSGSGSSIAGLAENLPNLGSAIIGFAETVKGIGSSQGDLEAAATAIATIVKALPVDIGVGLNIIAYAGVDYDALADGLPKLGHAIFMFAQNIAGMDTGSVENTQKACEIVMSLVNSLPKTYGGLASMFTGGTFIDDFANQLPMLGHAMFMYAQNIAGMDTGSVYNTEQACQIILSLAKSLPQTYGGLASMFAGGTFIDDFANQLPMLGHAFFMYAQNIAGMDTGSVYNTQQAAEIILSLSKSLGKTYSGLAGMLVGGTFIDDFSEQIPMLGHAFFMYAQNIGGMDTGSIANTDAAARMIIDLSQKAVELTGFLNTFGSVGIANISEVLPGLGHAFFMYAQNIGGMDTGSVFNTDSAARMIVDLCTFITDSAGFLSISRDIAIVDMAANLEGLGHAFFMYAEKIGGMDTGSVANTDAAARMIVSLCEDLSNSAGFLNISRDISMVDAATNIPALAHAFFMYAENIGGMDTASVANTTESIYKIIELIQALGTVDFSSANSFCDQLKSVIDRINNEFLNPLKTLPDESLALAVEIPVKLGAGFNLGLMSTKETFLAGGKALVDSLIQGIRNGMETVTGTVGQIINGIISGINSFGSQFHQSGLNIMKSLTNGVNSGKSTLTLTVKAVVTSAASAVNGTTAKFYTAGKAIMTYLSNGIKSNGSILRFALQSVVSSAANQISTQGFYNVGKYAMQGLAKGMKENDYIVKEASKKAAENALKAANDALKVASPSREFYKTGRWTMIGLANGISENAKYAESRSEKAASDILETTNKILSDLDMTADLNYDPVIRPVVDMTNVNQGIGYINNAFGEKSFSLGSISGIGNINTGIDRFQYDELMHKLDKLIEIEQSNDAPRSIEFNQFNNSPKALNTAEIYRQTKSQFSKLKDMVGK